MCVTASVGRDCKNGKIDVKTIQILLNMNLDKLPRLTELAEDGVYGNSTLRSIEVFQRDVAGIAHPDGKVDPDGKTLMALARGIPSFRASVLKGVYINAGDQEIHRYCEPITARMFSHGIDTSASDCALFGPSGA